MRHTRLVHRSTAVRALRVRQKYCRAGSRRALAAACRSNTTHLACALQSLLIVHLELASATLLSALKLRCIWGVEESGQGWVLYGSCT